MPWNWQLPDWPQFLYDPKPIAQLEKQFLLGAGSAFACLKTVDEQERKKFIVEILSLEGLQSSRIEGEVLDRESLQSSLRKHFGLQGTTKRETDKESRMARLLSEVYESFDEPLTHKMLHHWHSTLFKGSTHIDDCGKYRTHPEPMQIVSNRLGSHHVFFEAPPSATVTREMDAFIEWFNTPGSANSILGRAAIAHVYFESIHPFEDGNGRIGRVLVEKLLSQAVGQPVLIAISQVLEARKKEYYAGLELCNRTLHVQHWVEFFAQAVVEAHEESVRWLYFLIQKSKMMSALADELNPRQTKALLRMFAEGPNGFQGGMSAEKYIAVTKTTRATATRDLTELVKLKALTRTGELKHTRYRLNLSFFS